MDTIQGDVHAVTWFLAGLFTGGQLLYDAFANLY